MVAVRARVKPASKPRAVQERSGAAQRAVRCRFCAEPVNVRRPCVPTFGSRQVALTVVKLASSPQPHTYARANEARARRVVNPSRQAAKAVAARSPLTGQIEQPALVYPRLYAELAIGRRTDAARSRARKQPRQPRDRR